MQTKLQIILIVISVILPSVAWSLNNTDEASKPIKIKVTKNGTGDNGGEPYRAPMKIDIEAFYDSASGEVFICYNGKTEGEAYLYLNGNVVDYSGEINTTFDVTLPGLYEIEIITGSWTAYGSIEI